MAREPIKIVGTVTGAASTQQAFMLLGESARERVGTAIQRLGIELSNYIKTDKLSGGVLKVKTGRLRRSITSRYTATGTNYTATVGTNVAYARFWELGYSGTEQVRAHMRRTKNGEHAVKSFSRKVHVAARPFLKTSLDENRAHIMASLQAALNGAIHGGGHA